jgi:general secretion pathway protein A
MKAIFVDEALSHLKFFGLNFNPFPVAPDDENFYFSEEIEQIVTEIIHGIVTRKGFMVLTGDIGLGKTTISRWIMNILEKRKIETSLVFHTTYQDVELLAEINRDFGVKAEGPGFSDQMWALNQFLLDQNRNGRNCAIIIDDAQNLSPKSLELIRMISNLEAYHEKLVQVLLVGQSELMEKLNSKELRQLKSRIVISKEVQPLSMEEIKNYLQFKLNAAGNKGLISINPKAYRKLYQLTKGNLRQINTLMDRCLYAGFLNHTKEIDRQMVQVAHADLNPGRTAGRRPLRTWALAAAVAVMMVSGGSYTFYRHPPNTGEPPPLTREAVSSLSATPTVRAPEAPQQPLETLGSHSRASYAAAPVDPVPGPIEDFLRAYGLEAYSPSFFEALTLQRLDNLTETIYNHSGYWLIALETLPENIRKQYGVLAYPDPSGGKTRYYLFWRPSLRFPHFYYRLEGAQVKTLQEFLAQVGLYQAKLDGIVGKNLMQAILAFQKQAGLPVTGYPDEKTVFLLSHYEEIHPK